METVDLSVEIEQVNKLKNYKRQALVLSYFTGKIKDRLKAISIFILLLVLPSYTFYDVEHSAYDILTKLKFLNESNNESSHSKDICVLLIDDEALRIHGVNNVRSGKFASRYYLSSIFNQFAAMKNPPKTIGLDIRLDTLVGDGIADKILAHSIKKCMSRGIQIIFGNTLIYNDENSLLRPLMPMNYYLKLCSRNQIGFTNFLTSELDKVIRHGILYIPLNDPILLNWMAKRDVLYQLKYLPFEKDAGGPFQWSFPAALALSHWGELERLFKELRRKGQLEYLINFGYKISSIVDTYSTVQLFENAIDDKLKNKLVIIGSAYENSEDRLKTPLSTDKSLIPGLLTSNPVLKDKMPGVYLHAYGINSLREFKMAQIVIDRLSVYLNLFAFLGGCIIVLLCSSMLKYLYTILIIFVFSSISLYLYLDRNLYVPFIRPGAFCLLGYIITQKMYSTFKKNFGF